jgi:hypothetical protein
VGRFAILWLLLLVACNARLGTPSGSNATIDDAASVPTREDAAPIEPMDAPIAIDAPLAACFNGRVIYLAFEGVTLTQAATDDATQNHAQWIGVPTATVPPYHQGSATRAADITSVTDAVRTILSGFPVTVVTTRPTDGSYVLVALGGTKTTVGTTYGYATSYHDCGDLTKNDVAWVSDTVPATKVADYVVGAIGWALGLQGTNDPGDCMCEWANACVQSTAHCTLHGPIAVTASTSPATTCPGLTTQDETAAFHQAFCQP